MGEVKAVGREGVFYLRLGALGEGGAALGEDGFQVGAAGFVGRDDDLALHPLHVVFEVEQGLRQGDGGALALARELAGVGGAVVGQGNVKGFGHCFVAVLGIALQGLQGEGGHVGKLVAVEAQVGEEIFEPGGVFGLGHAVEVRELVQRGRAQCQARQEGRGILPSPRCRPRLPGGDAKILSKKCWRAPQPSRHPRAPWWPKKPA
jgi:hypothetical protein